MARITVEDCLEVVDNRFELVLMASKRARQLAKGEPSTIEHTHIEHEKPTVLALREIADRSIDNDVINAVDRAQRERREREALEWAAAEVVDDDLAKAVSTALTLNRDDCRQYALGYTWDQCARLFESHLAPIKRSVGEHLPDTT